MNRSVQRAIGAIAAGTAAVAVSVTLMGTGAAADSAYATPRFPMPKPYGTTFQKDPAHDFTKRIRPRHDGILRGWVHAYDSERGTVEYEPIKWVKRKEAAGYFVGPPEGDVTAYESRVSRRAVLYSALNCGSAKVTIDRRGLGTKRCSRNALVAHLKAGEYPAMITVYRGKIVKIQEIHRP